MAQKRMFSKQITTSDAFMEMPASSQLLYFHLNMEADDDGFVANPKRVLRTIGSGDDDLKILLAKRFILAFPSGVIVIKHWLIHNTLRMDRYAETGYTEEKKMLKVKENKAYTEIGNHLATSRQPSIDKISIVKNRIDKKRIEQKGPVADAPVKKIVRNDEEILKKFNAEMQVALHTIYVEHQVPRKILSDIKFKFVNYWTEKIVKGAHKDKFKFESENAFEISKRIWTFLYRDKNYTDWKSREEERARMEKENQARRKMIEQAGEPDPETLKKLKEMRTGVGSNW